MLLTAVGLALISSTMAAPTVPIRLMSFNIRYGTAADGDNAWPNRKALLMDVLREEKPTLIGMQEALKPQIDEIVQTFPDYALVGIGRDDGKEAGEYSAILYDTKAMKPDQSGTFWLSDTPTVPGSKTWGNNVTRICTWAHFVPTVGKPFYHFNVHLDHESQPSREKGVALMLDTISKRKPHDQVVITGDFNVGEKNPAVLKVLGAGFQDSYRLLNEKDQEVGTFTGFVFGQTKGDKIDYIFVPKGTLVLGAAIVRTSKDNRYPSDHFPVVAEIVLPEEQ